MAENENLKDNINGCTCLSAQQSDRGQSSSPFVIPVEGLSLSVAPYVVREKKVGDITAATYFCEGQLVWDNVMAINALNYLKANPDAVVIILAGTGHARKAAIPRQIRSRSQLPYTVILPEVAGNLDAKTVTKKDADYLLLDLG